MGWATESAMMPDWMRARRLTALALVGGWRGVVWPQGMGIGMGTGR